MIGCRPTNTSMKFNVKLGNFVDKVPVDKENYQQLVEKLIYLSHTRPNISYAVGTMSHFMQARYEEHMEATNYILRYLKTNPKKGFIVQKTNKKCIKAYTNLDWGGSVADRKFTSRYYTFVWSNFVTWRSKKPGLVARSDGEAEYQAMGLGIYEEIWLQKALSDIH